MAEFDDSRDERLQHEAEELMRQKRFLDAAGRYQDLRSHHPTDLWATLGHCSALECAGRIQEAEQILEEVTLRHKRSAPLHRFRRLFFERREDLHRAQLSTAALENDFLEDGPEDQLADLYFNQGRYHEARDELSRLLRADQFEGDEGRASVLARLGACLRQTNEYDEARRRLQEALAIEGDHHWTLAELAEVERAQGDAAAARTHYLAALKVSPEDHWCRGHLAQLEAEEGNRDRAETLYREILEVEPKTPWALVELAQLIAERDADQSKELCERALAVDPRYPWAHAHLGQLARRRGELEAAVTHFGDALDGAGDAGWVLHELADACKQLGRHDEARKHLDRALTADPYYATTYGYLADLLRHQGRANEAIAHLEKAVELDASYTWAWRELAELRAIREEHDAADLAYRKAVELDGEEAVNDGLRAFLLRCRGKRDAAQPWLERAVEKQGDYLWAWRELIDLHLVRGHAGAAEAASRAALEQIPDSPPLLGLHAEALRRLGRQAEALPVVDLALTHGAEVPQLHALRAEVLAEMGRVAEAKTSALKACDLDRSQEYRALLAQILIANDDDGAAEQVVRDLTAQERPLPAAYELAAMLAERADATEQALTWCERALAIHPEEPRLITRRAKLGLQLARRDLVQPLCDLVVAGGPLPWRDAAQILAQAGEGALARRAAHQVLIASDGESDERRAKAWLLVAEVELALARGDEALDAAAHALALDEDCVSARILSAVIHDRRGELDRAIAHLEHLDQRLHEVDEEGGDSSLLLRQLAGLYERAGRFDAAGATWTRICQLDAGAESAVDAASFALRCQLPGAEAQAEAVARSLEDPRLRSQLLRDRALARLRHDGAEAALELLRAQPRLDSEGRLLLAQMALAAGQVEEALRTCDALLAGGDARRSLRLVRVRALLASRRLADGLDQAQACHAEDADEEATTLLAEALALAGRVDEARSLAEPGRPAGERGLLLALLDLEQGREAAALGLLGRLDPPPAHHPLGRVFAVAWPGAWGKADLGTAIQADDCLAMPPLPQAAEVLGRALVRQGRTDLAVHLTTSVAATVAGQRPAAARRLRRIAAGWLRRTGSWLAALKLWLRG